MTGHLRDTTHSVSSTTFPRTYELLDHDKGPVSGLIGKLRQRYGMLLKSCFLQQIPHRNTGGGNRGEGLRRSRERCGSCKGCAVRVSETMSLFWGLRTKLASAFLIQKPKNPKCCHLLSVTVISTGNKKTSLGQKGLINLTPPGSSLSRKEIRAGTRRPELKQRPGKNTACELAPLALAQLSFFFLPSFLLPF